MGDMPLKTWTIGLLLLTGALAVATVLVMW